MKRVTRNGVLAVAATGAMAMTVPMSAAFAADGAAADGAAVGSPGLISGNTIQIPVDVPVNVCGDTVNVVGLLNPAAGNRCANSGASTGTTGTSATTSSGSTAQGQSSDSPGVLSGNNAQIPVHAPVNVSGNSVNVVGIGNPSSGNSSTNTSSTSRPAPPSATPTPTPVTPSQAKPDPERTPRGVPQPVVSPHVQTPLTQPSLAHTGADGTAPAVAASAALLLGGAVLYRRFRPAATR
ncbi:chaplin [Streptomyces sp. NPDC046985]|uniref:chaplin n=1 Tax=Streptomyces sp. NPDC046985 TaxID=3155377 RepID=UPI0034030608